MFKDKHNIEVFRGGIYDLANHQNDDNLIDSMLTKELIVCTKNLLETLVKYRSPESITLDNTPGYFANIAHNENISMVSRLYSILRNSKTSKDLKRDFNEIDDLLSQFEAIALGFENNQLKPDAARGKARRKQMKGWSDEGVIASTKYTDIEKSGWITQALELKKINPTLSMRSIATRISKANNNPARFESVRYHLRKEMGKPL